MATTDQKGSVLGLRGTPDRANDYLYVWNGTTPYRSTINNELGITGTPVGTVDSQTLTNKVITAPTISSPTLSGTITGTYVIGGTPTFPASVVTLTGSQTLTNKILTSPTISSPTITNASMTADSISGYTTANTGTIYGMAITAGVMPNSSLPSGTVVQIQATNYNAVATGTTVIPEDDTIPQITEGDQYMTQAITPKSATNRLLIRIKAYGTASNVNSFIGALFQDSTANALAATEAYVAAAGATVNVVIEHDMVAGTTGSTTFRFRAGPGIAGTLTFNGFSGARKFGGVTVSSIVVTEYKP